MTCSGFARPRSTTTASIALDRILPHKDALEAYLKERLGTLFKLEYDLLLYDITSTYFEGQASRNTLAARGYSRDHRPDCKQVCIGLVVTREGFPLGYEVFAGNRRDSSTLREVVQRMEQRYGSAGRIWVVDRGMIDAANLKWLQQRGSRYIVGTPKGSRSASRKSCSKRTGTVFVRVWTYGLCRRKVSRRPSFSAVAPTRGQGAGYAPAVRATH